MLIAITGVSRGLGEAMTRGFAELGHAVVGCARSKEVLASLQNELGSPHQFATVDVAEEAQVQQWAEQVIATAGVPDLLINAAATINPNGPLWTFSAAEFSRVLDVNVKGTFHTIRHFVPAMAERGSGVIVNFSSYWGRSTSSEVAAYCASKWAIEGLSSGLADDLPAGCASVALNPGVINTKMLESCFGSAAASYPSPKQWAESAVPFIVGLSAKDNGSSVTVPGF